MRLRMCVIAVALIVIGCSQSSKGIKRVNFREHELSEREKERQIELLTPIRAAHRSGSLEMEGDSIEQHSELLALADTTWTAGGAKWYMFKMEGDLSGIEGSGTFGIQVVGILIVKTVLRLSFSSSIGEWQGASLIKADSNTCYRLSSSIHRTNFVLPVPFPENEKFIERGPSLSMQRSFVIVECPPSSGVVIVFN